MPLQRNQRIAFSAAIGALQRAMQLIAALVMLPLALHQLGVAGFGVWGAATSLVWLTGILDFGLGGALITLVSQAMSDDLPELVRSHVSAALLASMAVSSGLLLLILVVVIAQSSLTAPFVVAGVGLALNIPLSAASSIWYGLQKGYVAMLWDCGQTVLTVLLVVASTKTGGGVTALVAAVFAGLVVANACSLTHLFLSQQATRPLNWRSAWSSLRVVMSSGLLLFGIAVASASSYIFDTLLALKLLNAGAAAQMTIALRLCTTVTALVVVMTQPLWAAFVDAANRDDRDWELLALCRGTLLVAAGALAGGLALVLWGPVALIKLMHTDLHFPRAFFWAMAFWIFFLSIPRVALLLFNAVGILRFQLALVGCGSLVALALKLLTAHEYGVSGILASAPIAWLIIVLPAFTWRAWRWVTRPAGNSTLSKPN